jgi:hypothetical protein
MSLLSITFLPGRAIVEKMVARASIGWFSKHPKLLEFYQQLPA